MGTTPTPILDVADLGVRYGSVMAVEGVSFEVHAGEMVGLIGANGAGKTTTIDAICGFVPHRGQVRVSGRDVSADLPHVRAAHGCTRTWQGVELFDDLTVAENCSVATAPPSLRQLGRDLLRRGSSDSHDDVVLEVLAALGVDGHADAMPSELSGGARKLVGVARALAAQPTVVLLDEPAAGLDRAESDELGGRLRSLVGESVEAAVLVDHDTHLVFDVCDRVVVLDGGRLIASGDPDEVRRDPVVIEAYLGMRTS